MARLLLKTLFFFLLNFEAEARMYDMYRADYLKGAFCSIIAGACAADLDFYSSFFQNPASLTAGGVNYDWDFDWVAGDNLEPGLKAQNSVSQKSFFAAIAYSRHTWGIGFSLTQTTDIVNAKATFYDDAAGTPVLFNSHTQAKTTFINLPISFEYKSWWHVGVTLCAMFQSTDIGVDGTNSSSFNDASPPALGVAIGGIILHSPYFRSGGWLRSPLTYYFTQHIDTSSVFTNFHYNEDYAINYPSMWAVGFAYSPYADKNTIFFDLNFVGSTRDGYELTYDNFATAAGDIKIQQKGRSLVLDPRLGWRFPSWQDQNMIFSLGTYYENSRWKDYPGLWHFTGGISYRWPNIKFIGFDGVELMAGADLAQDYSMIFLTYR